MSPETLEFFSRTTRLLRIDAFDGEADEVQIAEGLAASTVRIVADRKNLSSYSCQTAVLTLAALLARMGIKLDLDVGSVEVVHPQPPFEGGDFQDAITSFIDDFPPDRPSSVGPPVATFAFGDSRVTASGLSFRITGSSWSGAIEPLDRGPGSPWVSTFPVGGLAVAAGASTEGLKAAMPLIADLVGKPVSPAASLWPFPMRPLQLSLERYRIPGVIDLKDVDIISAGAITNSALYSLIRMPGINGRLRVWDEDILEMSNLNRYLLALSSWLGHRKVDALAEYSNEALRISAVPERFGPDSLGSRGELAPVVLVGVDHIPARWDVQAANPQWLCVGATSHLFGMVTTHEKNGPCAGCAHPRDDTQEGPIPTISFVSFWAGLIQALELLRWSAGRRSSRRATYVWPSGLHSAHGIHSVGVAPNPECPVGCQASSMAFDGS